MSSTCPSVNLLELVAHSQKDGYHLLRRKLSRTRWLIDLKSGSLCNSWFFVHFLGRQQMVEYTHNLPGESRYCYVGSFPGSNTEVELPQLRAYLLGGSTSNLDHDPSEMLRAMFRDGSSMQLTGRLIDERNDSEIGDKLLPVLWAFPSPIEESIGLTREKKWQIRMHWSEFADDMTDQELMRRLPTATLDMFQIAQSPSLS